MEAWIFHSHEEWMEDSKGVIRSSDEYSAWATEKQAIKAAADYLHSEITSPHGGVFYDCYVLWDTVKSLIEDGHYDTAIRLTNEYSQAKPPRNGGSMGPRKVQIIIAKSTFKGSVFE